MANKGGTTGIPLVPIYVGRGDFLLSRPHRIRGMIKAEEHQST